MQCRWQVGECWWAVDGSVSPEMFRGPSRVEVDFHVVAFVHVGWSLGLQGPISWDPWESSLLWSTRGLAHFVA